MIDRRARILLLTAILFSPALLTPPAGAQRGNDDVVTITVIPGTARAAPGQWFPVAVVIDLQAKWHLHTNDPQVPPALGSAEDYIKTAISAPPTTDGRLRPDLSRTQWPAPHMTKVNFGGPPVDYGVFEGRSIAYLLVEVPPDAQPGLATLHLGLTYQACDDRVCLQPVEGRPFSTQIAVDPAAAGYPADPTHPELFTGFDPTRLPAASEPVAAGSERALTWIAIGAAIVGFAIGFLFVIKRVF